MPPLPVDQGAFQDLADDRGNRAVFELRLLFETLTYPMNVIAEIDDDVVAPRPDGAGSADPGRGRLLHATLQTFVHTRTGLGLASSQLYYNPLSDTARAPQRRDGTLKPTLQLREVTEE